MVEDSSKFFHRESGYRGREIRVVQPDDNCPERFVMQCRQGTGTCGTFVEEESRVEPGIGTRTVHTFCDPIALGKGRKRSRFNEPALLAGF